MRKDRLHFHNTLQINYTTYDVRRAQDTIKPSLSVCKNTGVIKRGNSDHSTIMLAASETDQDGACEQYPFWFARVQLVFHVEVRLRDRVAQTVEQPDGGVASASEQFHRMDILWVRWFGRDLHRREGRGGWITKRLDSVGYVGNSDNPGAFGFIDPKDIVRACHLLPAGHHGLTCDGLAGESFVRDLDDGRDYISYYVSR